MLSPAAAHVTPRDEVCGPPRRSPRGRKSRLVIEATASAKHFERLTRKACRYARRGAPLRTIAGLIGCARGSLDRWLRLGRQTGERIERGEVEPEDVHPADALYLDFASRFDRAASKYVLDLVEEHNEVRTAGNGKWRGVSWMLERKCRDAYWLGDKAIESEDADEHGGEMEQYV